VSYDFQFLIVCILTLLITEKRKLVTITKSPTADAWEAIAVAPKFSDRVTPQELEAQTAEVTMRALEELLDHNRDFFDQRRAFSPKNVRRMSL